MTGDRVTSTAVTIPTKHWTGQQCSSDHSSSNQSINQSIKTDLCTASLVASEAEATCSDYCELLLKFMATLTYRALHGSAPPYLASSFTCVADMPHRRRLRSASTEQDDVPTCRGSTIGGRAFPVVGAKVWNGLPSDVTSASSLSVFKNRLKTYLFRRCYETF